MKRNKLIALVLVGLISAFALIGCDSDDGENNTIENNDTPVSTPANEEASEAVDNETSDTDAETNEEADADLAPLDAMIESSDYISKIKLIKKGQDSEEIKILDNIKAALSADDLPKIDTLELNRAYVIFLKDRDGHVVLADEADGVILLEGDNHELFEKIYDHIHR